MPALHCAITSSGTDTMNIGAPITGILSLPSRQAGNGINDSGGRENRGDATTDVIAITHDDRGDC